MRKILAFLTAAFLASSPLAPPAYAWKDTVFPDANDSFQTRIGSTSWVSLAQEDNCETGFVNGKCAGPLTNSGAVYSNANLVDPRGYNLPMIILRCDAAPGAPVKYSLQVWDNAWILDRDGRDVKVPNRIELNIDARDTLVLNGQASHYQSSDFQAGISQYQLLRIREATQAISESSSGSPGVVFQAHGTALAIDTLILACADKELKALLWRN